MLPHGIAGINESLENPQQEMKAAFEEEATDTGNTELLLTAAVSARKPTIDEGYQVDVIAE